MAEDLRVTLIQSVLHWEDIEANLKMFGKKIHSIDETDLIVLPETFSTGFTMNAALVAEEMDGRTVQWMQRMSQEANAVICGSVIIKEDDKYYNRLLWMRPDSTYEVYNKRHLFSLAKEDKTFTPGVKKLIVQLGDWTICPQVCYDLRFPVWARNIEDYDVLINVANWPKPRIIAWKTLLRARAIENQCYVIGLSRVGIDGNGIEHTGDSAVIDLLGEAIWTESGIETIQNITLSRRHIYETRRKFQFLADRDDFTIKT